METGQSNVKDNSQTIEGLNPHDVLSLFPKTVQDLQLITERFLVTAQNHINAIVDISFESRTFDNTAKALDTVEACSGVSIIKHVLSVIEFVSPDETMRKVARQSLLKINEFFVDFIFNNKALYKAFQDYVEGNAQKETLRADQEYFLKITMQNFKRNGLDLSEAQLEEVKNLKKELASLEPNYISNVAEDTRVITVDYDSLKGLDENFIAQLKRTQTNDYILSIDYPTYFAVMENCLIENTRKLLFLAFENSAYPINESLLIKIIAKRDLLAKKLGYESYADLDLSTEMAGTVKRVEEFVHALQDKADMKQQKEFEQLIVDLPQGMTLTPEGKLKPWDNLFIRSQYKKKKLNIDENEIAQYFPMEKAIQGLLDIYQKFFNLQFKEVVATDVWHSDVKLLQVLNAQNEIIGYLLLDLHPRPHKFTHACCEFIVPATYLNNQIVPGVAIVITNFPKATDSKPALLQSNDVATFFHEFGHALHVILGRTQMACFSGLQVKTDFVEMPSQMLEQWLSDPSILKNISSHYQTGLPLTDAMIKKIMALKYFESGEMLQRQLFQITLSLEFFKKGDHKNPFTIYQDLYTQMRKNLAFEPQSHFYTSFMHLSAYGAKYYSYLWSLVFALDLFDTIKKNGLLNPETGSKYIAQILSKGGSEDPNILLRNFLGREPNQEAFLRDMGLNGES